MCQWLVASLRIQYYRTNLCDRDMSISRLFHITSIFPTMTLIPKIFWARSIWAHPTKNADSLNKVSLIWFNLVQSRFLIADHILKFISDATVDYRLCSSPFWWHEIGDKPRSLQQKQKTHRDQLGYYQMQKMSNLSRLTRDVHSLWTIGNQSWLSGLMIPYSLNEFFRCGDCFIRFILTAQNNKTAFIINHCT